MVSQLCKGHVHKDIHQISNSPNVSQLLGFRQQQSLKSYQKSCDVFSIPTEPTHSRLIYFLNYMLALIWLLVHGVTLPYAVMLTGVDL